MILPLSFPDCAFNATSSTQGGFTIASRFTIAFVEHDLPCPGKRSGRIGYPDNGNGKR